MTIIIRVQSVSVLYLTLISIACNDKLMGQNASIPPENIAVVIENFHNNRDLISLQVTLRCDKSSTDRPASGVG